MQRIDLAQKERDGFGSQRGNLRHRVLSCLGFILAGTALCLQADSPAPAADTPPSFPLKVVGVHVTPHQQPEGISFNREEESPAPAGGRVQLFLLNRAAEDSQKPEDTVHINVLAFDGNEPKRNVFSKAWAWEDTPAEWPESDTSIPPGALTVFSFNSLVPKWIEPGNTFQLEFTDWLNARRDSLTVTLPQQEARLSSLSFLSSDKNSLHPDSLVFYLENLSEKNWKVSSLRIFQPYQTTSFRLLKPIASLDKFNTFPSNGILRPGQKMAVIATTPSHLKLTTAALEISLVNPARAYETCSLWEQLRVRRESFDIGAGWVSAQTQGTNILTQEPWLKTLKWLHINTANIQNIPGYTDSSEPHSLYELYPLKFMGTAQPLPEFDTDSTLPKFHAAESLGNVQDEINHCSPQDALELLRVYGGFRIPTSLILTDPWQWRHYAGISDYPHFNIARLAVPNGFERWDLYPRWEKPVPWGAPLETMGILTRNLRDNSRPLSISAWVQGPFDGWTSKGERKRLAPTPNELRFLAWETLSSRVASLHWFNLNIGSLVKYRDLLPTIQQVNREALALEIFFLYGDSWKNKVIQTQEDPPEADWELSSIICPRAALLCALDLRYDEDRLGRTFKFRRPREALFDFELPDFLKSPLDVFRIDANGVYDVQYQVNTNGVEITDKQSLAAIYVATRDRALRGELEKRRQYYANHETRYHFDPVNNRKDFDLLKNLARQTGSIIPEEEEGEEESGEDLKEISPAIE